MVVYNIHNLIHLPDDAMKHGSLEKISAFPFKVFMSSFLRQIKKPSKPFEQVVYRWIELAQLRNYKSIGINSFTRF